MIKIKSHELRLPQSEEQWRFHIALIIVNLFFAYRKLFFASIDLDCIVIVYLEVVPGLEKWRKQKMLCLTKPPTSFSSIIASDDFIHLFHTPGDIFLNLQFWRVVGSSNRYGFSYRNLLLCNVCCLEQWGLKKRIWGAQSHCLVMDVWGDSPISLASTTIVGQ